jgi:CysZ protein
MSNSRAIILRRLFCAYNRPLKGTAAVFASLRKAARALFDHTLSGVVLKSVLLTLLLYAAVFAGVEYGIHHLPTLGAAWVNQVIAFITPILLILLLFFLGAPVATLFASLFLEGVARKIEARYYPADPAPKGAPFAATLIAGLKLALLVFAVDLALLPADVAFPGIAEFVTILANGWLLGREYFEMVALRHLSRSAVAAVRRRHAASLFGAGVVLSVLTAVPVVDLFAPLFGVAVMVHLFKAYQESSA